MAFVAAIDAFLLAGFGSLPITKTIWLVCRCVGSRRARATFFCCPIWEHRNRFLLRLGNRTRGCRSESETDRVRESPVLDYRRLSTFWSAASFGARSRTFTARTLCWGNRVTDLLPRGIRLFSFVVA